MWEKDRSAARLIALAWVVLWSFPLSQHAATVAAVPPGTSFFLRSYDGTRKCLDYNLAPALDRARVPGDHRPAGIRTPPVFSGVFLNDCAQSHAVVVEELQNGRHEVVLHAGNRILGVRTDPASTRVSIKTAGFASAEGSLELLDPVVVSDHVFALDGDSIILESSRPCHSNNTTLCPLPPPQLVLQVKNGRGMNGSPIVLGPRKLIDPEFWDFVSANGEPRDPTGGFVHVSSAAELWSAVCASPQPTTTTTRSGNVTVTVTAPPPRPCAQFRAGWGTVIQVQEAADEHASINLSGYPALVLPAGVTLRGNRRGTRLGPQLNATFRQERKVSVPAISWPECGWCMIQVHGDYVRITGLRLRGQSESTDNIKEATTAIQIDYPSVPAQGENSAAEYIAAIDRNEIWAWEAAAIEVDGAYEGQSKRNSCSGVSNDQERQGAVQIARNFLHNNTRDGRGYGVVTYGGQADILGNTFWMNRHAIASDGDARSEYDALYNLVLSDVPDYGMSEGHQQQDFDIHGVGNGGYGGISGNRVEIAGNTFLGGNRFNFEVRGHPAMWPVSMTT